MPGLHVIHDELKVGKRKRLKTSERVENQKSVIENPGSLDRKSAGDKECSAMTERIHECEVRNEWIVKTVTPCPVLIMSGPSRCQE